ncbi:MAG: efflux RND transporter periplasmic adaptor subunit, partial [Gemmatimonadaceae bacterium]
KAGAIPERDLRAAQQALTASSARLAAAEARLKGVTQTMEDTRVVAPTTGVVSTRAAESGEHVTRGITLFTVVRNDVLELEASVPSRQSGELMTGQLVRFSAGGRQLQGKVSRISPTINPQNRTLTVYLQVPNARGDLRGNTFATGRIVTRAIDNTIVVPVSAVRQSQQDNRPFVYRIVNDQIDVALIEPGVTDELTGKQQVLSGLSVGDRIIVGNLGALGRGMPVRVLSTEAPGTPGARDMGGPGAPANAPPPRESQRPPGDSSSKRRPGDAP